MSGFLKRSKEPGVSMDPEIRIVRIAEALGRYGSGALRSGLGEFVAKGPGHRMAIDVVAQIGPDITLRGQRDNSLRRRRSRWRVALG